MKTMRENPIVPRIEQETIVNIDRETDTATIYTTDSRYINKLNKIYTPSNIVKNSNKIVAVEYKVPAKMISFRSKMVEKKSMTVDEKKALISRLKKRSN